MLNQYVHLNSEATERLGIDGGRIVKIEGDELVLRKNLKYYFVTTGDIVAK